MRISVKAKPRAREEKIEKVDESNFVVSVKEPPVQGKANFAIGKALAEYFKVPIFQVKLISGFSSKQKIFDIQCPHDPKRSFGYFEDRPKRISYGRSRQRQDLCFEGIY